VHRMIEQSIVHLPQAGKEIPPARDDILRCTYRVDAAWAGAVITVLVEEGVTASEPRWVGRHRVRQSREPGASTATNPTRKAPPPSSARSKAKVITEAGINTFERCGLDSLRIHYRLLGCLVSVTGKK
jgi:hypothetical protein